MRASHIVFGSLTALMSASLYSESNLNHSCVLSPRLLSCSPPTLVPDVSSTLDTCCDETFGGLFLSTQFWSTYTGLEAEGQLLPPNTWTLHGLWPDYCNGSYTQYCDPNRQYDPHPSPNVTNYPRNGTVVKPWTGSKITPWLEAIGKFSLLEYMNKYWINQGATNDEFWAHEFSKHATCFSTFDTPCYGPSYVEHQDLPEFYETAILYYQRLPTYGWLSAADIRPSNTSNTSLGSIQTALTKGYGALPFIGCSGPRYNTTAAGLGGKDTGFTVLSEVWYYFHAYGRPQEGQWVPLNATGYITNCANSTDAIRYLETTPTSLQT